MQTIAKPQDKTQEQAKRAPRKAWWRVAFESVVCFLIAVVVLESFFRIAGVGGQEFLKPDPILGTTHLPNKQVIWRMEGFSADTLNSKGYRDVEHAVAKAPGLKRVAVLGDSHSEGLQVPLTDTYARRLEGLLNNGNSKDFEVLNFACSGYSTAQEYVQYTHEVEAYKPDFTVILMHWGNTTANILDPKKRRVATPRPYFYFDGNGALQQDNSVAEWYLPVGAKETPWSQFVGFLQRNSRIYGVFTQTDMALNNNEKLYFKWRGNFQRVLSFFRGKNPKEEPPGPAYAEQDATKVSEAVTVAFADKCAKTGSKLIVMLLPDPSGTAAGKLPADLTALAKEHDFGFIDLTPAYNQHPSRKDLFLNIHLSSQGHKFVAETLKNYMVGEKLISASSSSVN